MPPLSHLRFELDQLDTELIHTLAKRIQKGREIQTIKETIRLPIEDKAREEYILKRIKEQGRKYNLSPQFLEKIYAFIFQEVKRRKNQDIDSPDK